MDIKNIKLNEKLIKKIGDKMKLNKNSLTKGMAAIGLLATLLSAGGCKNEAEIVYAKDHNIETFIEGFSNNPYLSSNAKDVEREYTYIKEETRNIKQLEAEFAKAFQETDCIKANLSLNYMSLYILQTLVASTYNMDTDKLENFCLIPIDSPKINGRYMIMFNIGEKPYRITCKGDILEELCDINNNAVYCKYTTDDYEADKLIDAYRYSRTMLYTKGYDEEASKANDVEDIIYYSEIELKYDSIKMNALNDIDAKHASKIK